ncbi:Nitroreductase [Gemmobacter aquatilis]|uniref:Putative NAD(P)H nitroreductase n=1 Tax=Gemmobacter aquatilis TaxID=933059 RepID=A0A1H8DLZ6_9RHOB|nr:nitroreductase [Gemmobacter aquatilis]SEN07794.1 Nitroreductase [Gemmobacter aquatilis]
MLQPNPAALDFLLARRSRPAKTLQLPVPTAEQLAPILTAALRVPDHGKLEPWRLLVLTKPAMARLADMAEARARATGGDDQRIAKGRGQFDQGHLAVVVISSPKAQDKVPDIEQTLSAGAVCLGLVNAAEAAGWGACWLTGWVSHDRGFAEPAFDLAPQERVAGIVHIGTEGPTPPERPRPDVAALTRWLTA